MLSSPLWEFVQMKSATDSQAGDRRPTLGRTGAISEERRQSGSRGGMSTGFYCQRLEMTLVLLYLPR